jgi:MFS family permease
VKARPVNIYQIVAVMAFCATGLKGSRVLMALYALKLGANQFEIGVLIAMYAVFSLVLALYAGRISDRLGLRLPLIGGAVGVTLGLVLPFLVPRLAMLYVSAGLIGAAFIFLQVSMQHWAGSLGDAEARTRNLSIYSLGASASDFMGPVIAGFAIDRVGHGNSYLGLALVGSMAIAGVLYFFRRIPEVTVKAEDHKRRPTLDLVRIPALRRTFIASGVVMTGVNLYQFYMPIYGHSIGISALQIGSVMGTFAVASFLVRSFIPPLVRRFGDEPVLMYSLYLAGAAELLVPFVSHAVLLAAISFVLGLGLGVGQPLSIILVYNRSPAGRAGEALGTRILVNNAIQVSVPLAFGSIGAALGLLPVFWANAAVLLGGSYGSRAPKKPPRE